MKLKNPCKSCQAATGRVIVGVVPIGTQRGPTQDLRLFNCVSCGTTRATKKGKPKQQSAALKAAA